MKKLFTILLILFSVLVFAPVTLAQENFRSSEVSILEKNETINKDYFATGEKVVLSGIINGDAYLAGGNIIVDGVVNGDLLVAGSNLNIRGEIKGDVRAAGGNIQIDGKVNGNVTTLGGNVKIGDSANIAGSLVAGAGNVEVFGPLGKGMTVGAGSLTIANKVGSDVFAGVEELNLVSNASISGNLKYISQKNATIAKEASVSGITKQEMRPEEVDEKENLFEAVNIGWTVFKFLSILAIGLLLLLGVPNFMQKIGDTLVKKPLASFGVGVAVLIGLPIASVLLAVTLIGIPLAVIVLVGYFFLIYIAKIFVALAIGEKILGLKANKIWSLILGLAVFTVLGLAPIVGGLIEFVGIVVGIGAYAITKRTVFQNLRTKKLI